MNTSEIEKYFGDLEYINRKGSNIWRPKDDSSIRYVISKLNVRVEGLYTPSPKVQGIISKFRYGGRNRTVWRIVSYGTKSKLSIGPNNELVGLKFSKYNKEY